MPLQQETGDSSSLREPQSCGRQEETSPNSTSRLLRIGGGKKACYRPQTARFLARKRRRRKRAEGQTEILEGQRKANNEHPGLLCPHMHPCRPDCCQHTRQRSLAPAPRSTPESAAPAATPQKARIKCLLASQASPEGSPCLSRPQSSKNRGIFISEPVLGTDSHYQQSLTIQLDSAVNWNSHEAVPGWGPD